MEIRNGFSFRASIRAGWYVAALGCISLSANAQSDFGQKIWWKADHNSFSAEVNRSLGTSSATYPAAGTPNVNGAKFSHAAGAWPTAAMKTNLPVPGKSAAIDVIARVKPVSVGAAFGRLATKVGPLSSVIALATFAAEVGFIIKGDGTVEKTNPEACTVEPCYQYRATSSSPAFATAYSRSPATVAAEYVSLMNSFQTLKSCAGTNGQTPTFVVWSLKSVNGTTGFTLNRVAQSCNYGENFGGPSTTSPTVPLGAAAAPVETAAPVPATGQELADLVASKSGWPTSSAISAAIAEGIKNGEIIEYDPAAVSGPASKPGSSSSTNNADGTVTTVAVTHNYTYNGPKVTVTTTTTTTNVNPATGATTTATKTDTEAVPDTPPTTEEEKNPCDLNPDALGCAELDTPSEEIPRETETIDFQAEDVFGDGSCPANLVTNVATLGQSVTVWDWQKTCEYAFPLRFLVLGLATFSALLIVMPGGSNQT